MAEVGNRTGRQTQAGRDVYETPEGEMVSEKSTTFEYEGKWINVPTIHGGKQYSEDQLMEMLNKGLIKPTSVHDELEEAIQAAQKRSDSLKFNRGGTLMLEKQMELFNDGGLYDEGGMIDEVSGNDVPPGSTRSEVRDDIPAMLSEGEFVFPADVVRYFGLEKLMEMRQQAKMGLNKMEAMGQMGNSEEATIPDDLPFSPEDLIIIEPQEFARGGVVKAQAGTFVQPSVFQDTSLNTPNFIPPSSIAPVNPQGTSTGYGPTFLGQNTIVPTGQTETITNPSGTGSTGTTDTTGTDFVPTVNDVYEFRKYKNTETGEVREFSFYMGQPVIPIPEGFVPYVEAEETPVTDDLTNTTVDSTFVREENDRDDVFNAPAPSGPNISEMSAEELAEAARSVRTLGTIGTAAGLAINPVFGVVMVGAARLQRNAIEKRAAELGIKNPLDAKGQGIIGQAGNFVNDIVDNIKSIFTTTEEEAVRRPTGSRTKAQTPVAPDTIVSPTVTPAPAINAVKFNADGTVYGLAQAARPGARPGLNNNNDDDNNDNDSNDDDNNDNDNNDNDNNDDRINFNEGRANSAARALETSRAGTSEVLSNIASRGKAEGKSDTAIINEVAAANTEARRVESALRDMSKGIQRGVHQGGLAVKKQIAKNNPINKDRGVAARKKK